MEKESNYDKIKLIATIILIVIVLGLIVYLGIKIIKKQTFNVQRPIATIEVENYGEIKVELYPEQAPEAVSNFIKLANNGFYDGLIFHRTIPDFMIQGGDPLGNGQGSAKVSDLGINVIKQDEWEKMSDEEKINKIKEIDSKSKISKDVVSTMTYENLPDEYKDREYNIKGEFIANNVKNTLKHERGVISMARSDYSQYSTSLAAEGYNSACSQFFITTTDQKSALDGLYASFGKVIENGMEVVERIANVEVETREAQTDSSSELTQDRPKEPPVIKTIRVETYGIDYGMPETKEPFDLNSWYISQMQGQM